MKDKVPIFSQDNGLRRAWDVVVLVFIYVSAITIPYELVAGAKKAFGNFNGLYWVITAIFSFDILINLNTTVKVKLALLTDRKSIMLHYLRTWFILDFLAAFPFAALAVFIEGHNITGTLIFKVLIFLRMLRFVKLVKAGSLFQELQDYLNITPGLMRLFIFIFWFTIAAHLMSLGWILIGASESERPFLDQYIRALYWCVTTIATIGYGDYYPNHDSNLQIIYTITVQIVGVGMFGYIIGNIATLIANLDVAKARFMEKMEEIKEYLRSKKIPPQIQEKVKNYYRYLSETRKTISHISFLDEIPYTLRMEISLFLNRTILNKVSLFKNAEEVFIREVVQLLEPIIFLPNDFIITQGEYGDCMYFLSSGDVEVIVNGTRVAVLGAGSPFGETALIKGEKGAPRSELLIIAMFTSFQAAVLRPSGKNILNSTKR